MNELRWTDENGTHEAEMLWVINDGESVEVWIPEEMHQKWPGQYNTQSGGGYRIASEKLDALCACGNVFRLCHPEA